ncbi:MAG: O-methyltransferase [Bacteroidetes bacterium]|nr:O-methyltransferase [Bacteroidota bacterium]
MIKEELQKYAEEHSSPESEVLFRLNRETHLKTVHPRMLSGHLQGKFLEMISCMIKPKQILEIGTFTGYSAICLSKGLSLDGCIHTIEKNPELQHIAMNAFQKAGIENQIIYYSGDAMYLIPEINEKFDLVFIDADKENYLNYYHLVFDKLNPGAFILADNTLWSGKVIEEASPADKDTVGLLAFNDFVQQDARVENLLLPFRDGIMMVRKL